MGIHAACTAQVFYPFALQLDGQGPGSKSQEVESILSHPLKFAESGAAYVVLMEEWASPRIIAGTRLSLWYDSANPSIAKSALNRAIHPFRWPSCHVPKLSKVRMACLHYLRNRHDGMSGFEQRQSLNEHPYGGVVM